MLSDFFAALLPQRGRFIVFTKHNKKNTAVDSHEELIAKLDEFKDTPDTYYGTAAFGGEISPKTGDIARTQSNVIGRRCLHLDLDCGEGKDYPNQKAALADLKRFQDQTGLKFSHVLSSGKGIHAYIAFNDDIQESQWKPLAKRFQALLRQVGVKDDPACTTDSSRVLRAPGSLHNSGSRVKLLVSTGVTADPLDLGSSIVSLLAPENIPAPEAKRKSINDDALEGMEGPPKSLVNIAKNCAAMRQALRAQGNIPEPYWRAMIGVIKHTVEGAEAAHKYSQGHPDYNYQETQAKLDAWATGPTTCAEFSKHCDKCSSCPHWGQIKSPIVKGVMTMQQVETLPEEKKPEALKPPAPTGAPWDGRIPTGFKVKTIGGQDTLVWAMPVENENEDGDRVTAFVDVPFTNDIFWFSQWADAEHSDDGAQVIACKWVGDHARSYELSQTLIENQQKLREALAGKSIFTTTHKQARRAMEEYTKAQIQRIRSVGQKPKINTRFGIRVASNGQLIAAQGDKVIYPNGEIREGMLGDSLKAFAKKAFVMPLPPSPDGMWGPEVWDSHLIPAARQHVEFLRQHFSKPGLEKLQLAAMMTLASPMMPFVTGEYHTGLELPPNGFSVSLYSRQGGRGKTSIMKAASLAFGKPSEMTRDQNELGSTEKARIARLTLLGSCPIAMDEMGSNSARSVANLVSAIANGTSREGATVDGGLRMGSTWALSCVIAANKSQREMIAAASAESSAIQYRMIELDVQNLPEFDPDEIKRFSDAWGEVSKTAGALGALIHRRICELGVEKANKFALDCASKARELLGSNQTGRFQHRALGAIIAVHKLLMRDNLAIFDLKGIVHEFKVAQDGVDNFVSENLLPEDPLELMGMFLNDQMENTLVTENLTRRSGVVRALDHPLGKEPQVVTVRHIVSVRRSYVNAETFRTWCTERGLSQTNIVAECANHGVIERPSYADKRVKTYFNLYSGTARSSESRIWCYCVNLGKLNTILGREDGIPAEVLAFKRPEDDAPVEKTA